MREPQMYTNQYVSIKYRSSLNQLKIYIKHSIKDIMIL